MTSREPGQCPGIWDSAIHKDMVTDGRETDRGQRQSLESMHCIGEDGGGGKKVEAKLLRDLEPGP